MSGNKQSTFAALRRTLRRSLGPTVAAPLALGLGLLACDDGSDTEGEGTLRVTIYGEPFIEEGIPAEEVVDGWAVDFSSFEVDVSEVAADGTAVSGAETWQLAMNTGGEGQLFGSATVPAGTVETLDYRITRAHVVGTATRDTDTLTFDWTFDTDTRYVGCETEQALAKGGEATSEMTIHADHLLYDDLVSGDPELRFDIIAGADADGDGEVTQAELAAVDITGEDNYQVGDAPITDLWAYLEAQTRTLGHIDGEGHCDTE